MPLRRLEAARRQTLESLASRIILYADRVKIEMNPFQLGNEPGSINLDIPIEMRRRGVEKKIVLIPNGASEPDNKVIKLIADTRNWFDQLATGKSATVRELALQNNVDENDISRFLPLAFLAPDIIEIIIAGKQPPELTAEKLNRLKSLPLSWEEQHRLLGFTR